jgi:hypothetical protein
MRTHLVLMVVFWAICSALCVSVVAYLGASSPARAPWLSAGAVGAVLGACGGAAVTWWRGQRGGSLLMGVLFAVLLAIAYLFWRG